MLPTRCGCDGDISMLSTYASMHADDGPPGRGAGGAWGRRALAARPGRTLTKVIEDALRQSLARGTDARPARCACRPSAGAASGLGRPGRLGRAPGRDGGSCSPDVGVLVRAYREDAPDHERYLAWLEGRPPRPPRLATYAPLARVSPQPDPPRSALLRSFAPGRTPRATRRPPTRGSTPAEPREGRLVAQPPGRPGDQRQHGYPRTCALPRPPRRHPWTRRPARRLAPRRWGPCSVRSS